MNKNTEIKLSEEQKEEMLKQFYGYGYTRVENVREFSTEQMALEMIETGSNDAVKVKMAELVVASIRNMSIEEIKTIRNFTEKDPSKYVKFDI